MSTVLVFGPSADGFNAPDTADGNPICLDIPVGIKISTVSAGSRHTLLLTSNGFVYSFGWGILGQLGLGNSFTVNTPTKIDTLSNIVEISAGGMHSACIDKNNKCYMWGCNDYGQLGVPLIRKPVSSSEWSDRSDSEKIGYHERDKDYTIVTPTLLCKWNRKAQNDVSIPTTLKPHGVFTGRSGSSAVFSTTDEPFLVKSVSCGGMHTGAIDVNGQVWCWGRSDSGQTGFPANSLVSNDAIAKGHHYQHLTTIHGGIIMPFHVADIKVEANSISCGAFHTLILDQNGVAYSMGKDDFGMLGIGAKVTSAQMDHPNVIEKLSGRNIIQVSCGGWHSIFLDDEGIIWMCGKGEYGRLGLGDEQSQAEPVVVPVSELHEDEKIVEVAAGGSHTVALSSFGRLFCCGRTTNGRLGFQLANSTGKTIGERLATMTVVPVLENYMYLHTRIGSPETLNCPSPVGDHGRKSSPKRMYRRYVSSRNTEDVSIIDMSAGGNHTVLLLDTTSASCLTTPVLSSRKSSDLCMTPERMPRYLVLEPASSTAHLEREFSDVNMPNLIFPECEISAPKC